MKHHNKFKVNRPPENNGGLEVVFSSLGPVNKHPIYEGAGTTSSWIPYNGDKELELLLNAVYDQAYEKGREAVRVCMNEAMGFDGE